MPLTPAQSANLKTYILSQPDLAPLTSGTGTDFGAIVAALNATADPDFWVWRPSVTKAEIYNKPSPSSSSWDWTTFKAQAVPEQNCWFEMFSGGAADFTQQTLRDGIGKIFGAANAQTTHCLAHGRTKATRAEKVLIVPASGAGSTASPAVRGFLGDIQISDISAMFVSSLVAQ